MSLTTERIGVRARSLSRRLVTSQNLRRIWFERDGWLAVFKFAFADVFEKAVDVFVERSNNFGTSLTRCLYDWIGPHVYSPMSSSGVQITGGSYPRSRHTFTMARWIVAFAMCRQFQVSRYCMP